jgi:hypothetical protein
VGLGQAAGQHEGQHGFESVSRPASDSTYFCKI